MPNYGLVGAVVLGALSQLIAPRWSQRWSTMNQRWRKHRTLYRPAGEVIRTREYDVAAIESDAEAKAFIAQHHYSHSYPAARFRFGLYRGEKLCGVAVFSHPCNDLVLTRVFRCGAIRSWPLSWGVLCCSIRFQEMVRRGFWLGASSN